MIEDGPSERAATKFERLCQYALSTLERIREYLEDADSDHHRALALKLACRAAARLDERLERSAAWRAHVSRDLSALGATAFAEHFEAAAREALSGLEAVEALLSGGDDAEGLEKTIEMIVLVTDWLDDIADDRLPRVA